MSSSPTLFSISTCSCQGFGLSHSTNDFERQCHILDCGEVREKLEVLEYHPHTLPESLELGSLIMNGVPRENDAAAIYFSRVRLHSEGQSIFQIRSGQ